MIPIVISTISHFWSPYPSNFLVVFLYIVIFHGINLSSLPRNIFFMGLKVFFLSCSQGLEKFQISWRPSVVGETNIFFGRGGSVIFFHKTINDQISKLSVSYLYTNFSHFQLRIFRLRIFCLFKRPFNIVWYKLCESVSSV